jgi:hypothetical protein
MVLVSDCKHSFVREFTNHVHNIKNVAFVIQCVYIGNL